MPKANAERQNPTPRGTLARFELLPPYLPEGVYRFQSGARDPLGEVKSGLVLAIDNRWWDVLGCTSMNGWVTVRTPFGNVTAHESSLVHVAWRESADDPVPARW